MQFGTYLKILKTPQGPTITFKVSCSSCACRLTASLHLMMLSSKVNSFCHTKDVKDLQKRPVSEDKAFHSPPLVVVSGMTKGADEEQQQHLKLVSMTLQNLFPPIDVSKIKLNACRRVVLFHRSTETGQIEMRHFLVMFSVL